MRNRTKISIMVVLALLVGAVIVAVQPVFACTEGCTPGFWKQEHHFYAWPDTLCTEEGWAFLKPGEGLGGCDESTALGDEPWNFLVQDVPGLIPACLLDEFGNLDLNGDGAPDTLLDALEYKGGSGEGHVRNLLRAAVAGLLNGMTMDHFAPWQIIFITNGTLDMDPDTDGCQQRVAGLKYWYKKFDEQNNRGCVFSP